MHLPLIATRRSVVAGIGATLAMPAAAFARAAEIHTGLLSSTAVGGYDAVAYFTEGKPVVGKKDTRLRLEGRDVAVCNREEPRRLQGEAGGLCAAIWRSLRLGGQPRLHGQRAIPKPGPFCRKSSI